MAAHNLNFNLETAEMMRFQLGTFWSEGQCSTSPLDAPKVHWVDDWVLLVTPCPSPTWFSRQKEVAFLCFHRGFIGADEAFPTTLLWSNKRICAWNKWHDNLIILTRDNFLNFFSFHVLSGLWDIRTHFKLQIKAGRCVPWAGGKHFIFPTISNNP